MGFHRGRAYGQALRERVLEARGSQCEVAKRFAVSAAYVAKVRARRRDLGADTPEPQRNHVPMKLAGHEQALAAQVQARPDQTLQALYEWAQEACGIAISISAMHKTLARLGLTRKKSRCMRPSRSEGTSLSSGRPG